MGNLLQPPAKCQEVEISKRLGKKRQKQWEDLIQKAEVEFSEVRAGITRTPSSET